MARHYVKVPAFLRDYFPGEAPDNWRETVVADATDGGHRLTVEPMPPNERGPRIAVHGDLYYFWLAKDQFRPDTLFVMRIEQARNPRRQVSDYSGTFQLWPGGHPEVFDSVADLFGGESNEPEPDEELEAVAPEPSPLLLRAIADVPASVVSLFRPEADGAAPLDVPVMLQDFRRFWRRYYLRGRLELPLRLESVLQGGVQPSRMAPAERRLLSDQLGLGALNVLVLAKPSTDRFAQVLRAISSLPLDAQGRAAMWMTLIRGLGAAELRRELKQVATSLLQIPEARAAEERLIADGVLIALREVSARDRDVDLHAIAEAAGAAEAPLAHVANWAKSLDFAEHAVEEEPGPAADESAAIVPLEPPGMTQWIAQVSFPDASELQSLVSDAARVITAAQSRMAGETLPELLAGLDAMQALRDDLDNGVSRLPVPVDVTQLESQARAAGAEMLSLLGELPTVEFLGRCEVVPDDLLAIVKLLRRREDLQRAPKWLVWPDQDPPLDLATATPPELALLLADAERRQRWQKFLDCLQEIGEPAAVAWLQPPVDGVSVDEALDEWLRGARAFLEALTPDERIAAVHGDPRMSPATRPEVEREENDLANQLSDEAGHWLRKRVKQQELPLRLTQAQALSRQVGEFCHSTRLGAKFVTIEMLARWAAQSAEIEAPRQLTINVRHDWVRTQGMRATLMLVQHDPQLDLAYFDAPLVLETEEPRAWTLRMVWKITTGGWRASWPSDYPSIEPDELTVAKYQWRRDEEDKPYQHTFRLRIPVRVPRDRKKHLAASVTLSDAKTNRVMLNDHVLRWESLDFKPATNPISVVWSTVGSDDDVTQHPIGPQLRASEILRRLEARSCTAVIAPRRFGKTTLVNYLASALPSRGIYAAPPVVCTEHRPSLNIDYGALWHRLSEALRADFGTGLLSGWQGPLPPEAAFDAVRRAARKRGDKAIVLLFDEAQFFFPSDQGPEIGTRLKARLEGTWCAAADDMVPVLFCFVGLPALVQRIGADLTGLLMPIEAWDMTERQLRPLVKKKVPSLQTTRRLRSELARTSGNLYILRVLLNRLAARVNDEQRTWASIDDLTIVSRDLARDLREGREESLAAYIRDVLNEADDVNIWAPMACVPVASAIAHVRSAETSLSLDNLMRQAAERLSEWSRARFTGASQPVYDEKTIRHHFDKLAELKVVSDTGHVESSYLEAWLSGLARRRTADGAFDDALFSGGQRRIRLPTAPQVVRRVGNTRILKAEDQLGALAFRVRRFEDDGDRTGFLENVSTFDSLRKTVNGNEDGSAFIFRLEDVGLSMVDAREAIQMYRWVDGEDLESRVGCLAPEHVLDIGIKLGRALVLLHRRGILHRDIQPGNIVIDEGEDASEDLRPVLIDFGFARVVGRGMRTRLSGEFAAPEVCAQQPEWSRASDIFSLGATLRAVLHKTTSSDAAKVRRVLEEALNESPTARPSAETFTTELQQLAARLHVQQRRDTAWSKVRSRLGQGVYVPELSATVNRHRTVLELLELGSYDGAPEERHRVVADIINQFVERKRSNLKRVADVTKSRAVEVLHALRVLHAHPETVLNSEHKGALAEYRKSTDKLRSGVVQEGISIVSRHLDIPALLDLLRGYA